MPETCVDCASELAWLDQPRRYFEPHDPAARAARRLRVRRVLHLVRHVRWTYQYVVPATAIDNAPHGPKPSGPKPAAARPPQRGRRRKEA